MGFIGRRDFSGGWQPNADAVNAPENCLLRGDNLTHDEQGIVALRRGSAKINGSPLADTDVHSLFTAVIAGTRYRMAGASSAVYANGSSIASGLAGSGDIAFGFQKGQILFARSTSKKKYDGTTVRNWGIAKPTAAPTVTPVDPDGKTLATCSFAEDALWSVVEPAGGLMSYSPNHYLPADPLYNIAGSVRIYVGGTSKVGVLKKTFASPVDFSLLDGGRVSNDDDLITTHIACTYPAWLDKFVIQVDVNDGTFLKDYYQSPVVDGNLLTNPLDDNEFVPTTELVPQIEWVPGAGKAGRRPVKTLVRPPRGVPGGSGLGEWARLQWKRGEFTRAGSTFGKGWDTVKAIRLYAKSTTAGLVVLVDQIRISGGALYGTAQWRYVYVRNASGYQALSAPSEPSTSALFENQNATVSIPSDASRDSQVNEIWLFRQDVLMENMYRVQVKTGVSGTGGYSLTDALTTQDALTANIKIEFDNLPPPANIIAIVGPHYDRTLVLTSDGILWPSRKLDPDAFASSQAITVCGEDEQALWMLSALTDVFIGTTKDIYRLDGTGAENPDGSIDYIKRGLSMDHRPLNTGLAHEGNQIVFFSDDGWRGTEGTGSTLLTGATSLLYRGETRHGVSPVNVTDGRVRASLWKGQLVAIVPEGSDTTSSVVLYRYVFATGRWYRHVYPVGWRSIHREPDGTLIAGDTAGTIWTLDTGTVDGAAGIPVTLWTKVDDCGMPFQRKKLGDLTWRSETGGQAATIAVHIDGSSTASALLLAGQTGMGVDPFDLASTVAICKQVQCRLTGTFQTFRLFDFGLQFRERPIPIIGRVVMTHAGSPGVKILSGFTVTLNTYGVARLITPVLDNVPITAQEFVVTTDDEEPETRTLRFTPNALRATDIAFAVDCETEIDSWSPIVSQHQPVGVLVWDSGPIDLGAKEMQWLRQMFVKVRASADLVITPYFDGVAFPSLTAPVTSDVDTILEVPVGRSYVGRQPRLVVRSCGEFYPYFVRFVRRQTGSASRKDVITVPFKLEAGG